MEMEKRLEFATPNRLADMLGITTRTGSRVQGQLASVAVYPASGGTVQKTSRCRGLTHPPGLSRLRRDSVEGSETTMKKLMAVVAYAAAAPTVGTSFLGLATVLWNP